MPGQQQRARMCGGIGGSSREGWAGGAAIVPSSKVEVLLVAHARQLIAMLRCLAGTKPCCCRDPSAHICSLLLPLFMPATGAASSCTRPSHPPRSSAPSRGERK